MRFEQGGKVQAAHMITEAFMGQSDFCHAAPGELGRIAVVGPCGEWLTVTWSRHGTTTDVHVSELRPRMVDGHAFQISDR